MACWLGGRSLRDFPSHTLAQAHLTEIPRFVHLGLWRARTRTLLCFASLAMHLPPRVPLQLAVHHTSSLLSSTGSFQNVVSLKSAWWHLKSVCSNSLKRPAAFLLHGLSRHPVSCYRCAWSALELQYQVFISPDKAWCSQTLLWLLCCWCIGRVGIQFCVLFAISSQSHCFPFTLPLCGQS